MERLADLAIILKTYPFQERDRIAVCLTEHHGRITALAKGGIHSRRFGGSLDFLACSKLTWIQKPHADMARIEEAHSHHEFAHLAHEYERLTAASFAAEFCLRLLEPGTPARELFVILSNTLHQLSQGLSLNTATNAFLCKAFKALGYPPSLLRCVQCAQGAHQIIEQYAGTQSHSDHPLFYWYSEAGGMVCWRCAQGRFKVKLSAETLLYFHKLSLTPFKELKADTDIANTAAHDAQLFRLLSDFLHHHIPGLPAGGLKSWRQLSDALIGDLSMGLEQPKRELDRTL